MSEVFRDRLVGRWTNILPHLGIPAKFLNGKHQPCPMCGGKDRARFDNKNGDGTWICTHCGAGDGVALVMRKNGWDFKTAKDRIEPLIGAARVAKKAAARSDADRKRDLNALWQEGTPVTTGCPAGLYLTRRTGVTEYPSCLRAVDSMRWWGGDEVGAKFFPGMLAMVTGPDGRPANIHRTYLTRDGSKAPVDVPRRMMPGPVPRGAAVRLAPAADALGVAEGIETAISAGRIHGLPTWSVLGTAGLAGWLPPPGVTRVVVFGDNDRGFAGQAAAYALGHRLLALPGRPLMVDVVIPGHATTGRDWNDAHAASLPAGVDPVEPGVDGGQVLLEDLA